MLPGKILVVDDDPHIVALVKEALELRGFTVHPAFNGLQALEAVSEFGPDLIILDIVMPGLNGLDLCQQLRRKTLVPIFFLSGRSAEMDVILGLGLGADRYITKPFHIKELVARVEATLRREKLYRSEVEEDRTFRLGDLTVNLSTHRVFRGEAEISLTPTEFRLLTFLYENAGRVISRERLLDYLWENRAEGVLSRTVDMAVGRLRRKIEPDPKRPRFLITVPGFGYRLDLGSEG